MNCEALPRRLLRWMRWGSEKESLSTSWKSRGSAWKFCNKSRKLINLYSGSDSPKGAKIIMDERIGSRIIRILKNAQILTASLNSNPVIFIRYASRHHTTAPQKSRNPQIPKSKYPKKESGPHPAGHPFKYYNYLSANSA